MQTLEQQLSYIEREILRIAPFPITSGLNGTYKIKLFSDRGETRVMNLTDEQFRRIELALSTQGD